MDALSFAIQRSINLEPIISEVGDTKDVVALRKVAGYDLFATVGTGFIRGGIETGGSRAYFVSGTGFYEITTAGTATLRGTLNTVTPRCSLAFNGSQVMIVDGVNGYIFTESSNTFAQISDGDFPNGASIVDFQDQYFIVDRPNGGFAISALNDGTSWDALDFAIPSSNPDAVIGLISDKSNLWLFGNRSVEVYRNTGNASFPFERIGGAIIQTGCEAPHTVAKADNTIVWLGVDENGQGVVWKAQGYNAVRISTQAIEKRILESSSRDESYAWVYHQQGHMYYCLQVKGLDTTLVYDFATQQWHERSYQNTQTNEKEQHRGSVHIFFGKKNLIGDRDSGNIYELSLSKYDHAGEAMHCERISPHYDNEKALMSHNTLELDCEVGVGLTSGQGSDPQIMMQYSNSGGRTWSSELWKSVGKKGEYRQRPRWTRLGVARDRVYKLRYTEPTQFQINKAMINGH